MKLSAVVFARLIARVTLITNWQFDKTNLEDIYDMIEFEVPEPQFNKVDSKKVVDLLSSMQDKFSMIPAIRAYRELTGAGLMEAKNVIEIYYKNN